MWNSLNEFKSRFDQLIEYSANVIGVYEPFYLHSFYKVPVYLKEEYGRMAYTDGKSITFCYPGCSKWTPQEFAGVYLHELMHILNLHIPRRGSREGKRWNFATDYYINGVITQDSHSSYGGKISLPAWVLYDTRYLGMSSEDIYDGLPKNPELKDQSFYNGVGVFTGEINPEDLDGYSEYVEDGEAEEFAKELLRESRSAWGEVPKGISRSVIEIIDAKPRVNWKAELKQFVTPYLSDYSYSVRDYRFPDIFIPGTEKTEKGKIKISAGIDLSGSISDKDVIKILNECLGIEKMYQAVEFTFIPFDVKTYGSFKTKSKNEIISAFGKFKGGGGTSFVKVLEELDKDDSKVIIMFTDLYGTFPSKSPKKGVIWVDIVGDYKKDVPFGKVVAF